MSTSVTEEDVELKDLVAKVLDDGGILGKMKAQLRAHVYTALETGNVSSTSQLANPSLRQFLSSTSGRLVASLVREFLEFFHLDFSLAVFDPETNLGHDFQYRGRTKLMDALGLTELVDPMCPLLSEVMRLSKVSVLKSESCSPTPSPSELSQAEENTSNQLSLAHDLSKSDQVGQLNYRHSKKAELESNCEDTSSHSSTTPQLSLHLDPGILPTKPSSSLVQAVEERTVEHHIDAATSSPPKHSPTKMTHSKAPAIDVSKSPLEPMGLGVSSTKDNKGLLSDLPPLGHMTSLGDLPPLTGGGGGRALGLAPLKRMQPIAKPVESDKESDTAAGGGKNGGDRGAVVSSGGAADNQLALSSLGFQKDNVIIGSESPSPLLHNKVEDKKISDKYSDDFSVSEEIEEDMDSFLNSMHSNPDNLTKEETVPNSDVSLRADHVESL